MKLEKALGLRKGTFLKSGKNVINAKTQRRQDAKKRKK
jgi:hypothetical protein